MKKRIESVASKFLEQTKEKEILVISHFDTDGITSAAIMTKTLRKLDKTFSVLILKSLEEEHIKKIPEDKIVIFLDLASNSLNYMSLKPNQFFIIDHHEIIDEIPENVEIINPQLMDKEKISSSGLVYLFCNELADMKETAKLAILGMIGDRHEKDIEKLNNGILNDGEITRKRGLLIFPSTRPLNRVLEFSSTPYIPGVTGDLEGVITLLREANLKPENGKYKSILELNDKEMEDLTTAIMLREPKAKSEDIIGDIFLIKHFNKSEDARELSSMVNACSRMGNPWVALQFCLEISKAKKEADALYAKYRRQIISGLEFVKKTEKINGNGYVIINGKEEIKDTLAGTITSILASSSTYEEGTIITTLANSSDKIKISSRSVGKSRNVREVLHSVVSEIGGEVGGHEVAAGALIEKGLEQEFLEKLKKHLEIEMIKV